MYHMKRLESFRNNEKLKVYYYDLMIKREYQRINYSKDKILEVDYRYLSNLDLYNIALNKYLESLNISYKDYKFLSKNLKKMR